MKKKIEPGLEFVYSIVLRSNSNQDLSLDHNFFSRPISTFNFNKTRRLFPFTNFIFKEIVAQTLWNWSATELRP